MRRSPGNWRRCVQAELVALGLNELMLNALEHGVLGIGFERKRALIESGRWLAEIDHLEASAASLGPAGVVVLEYRRINELIRFTVRDCGAGFDWRAYMGLDPLRGDAPNGRGIAIARLLCFDSSAFATRDVKSRFLHWPLDRAASEIQGGDTIDFRMYKHILIFMKIISLAIKSQLLAFGLLAGTLYAAEPPIELGRVESGPVASSYPAEATIEALDASTVAAQVQGRVVDVRVDAGSRVSRGDILMRIDASEADQAVAAADALVAQARANLSNARASYDRNRSLVARNFISRSALDQSEANWRAAEAQLKAATASRAQAATNRGFATVTAPISGIVSARLIEQGEMAQPGVHY